MAVFIGGIGINGTTFNINQKQQKEALESYVYWIQLGFSKKAFFDDMIKKYWMVDDDIVKEKLQRLLDKNAKLLQSAIDGNKMYLPKDKIKFIR